MKAKIIVEIECHSSQAVGYAFTTMMGALANQELKEWKIYAKPID